MVHGIVGSSLGAKRWSMQSKARRDIRPKKPCVANCALLKVSIGQLMSMMEVKQLEKVYYGEKDTTNKLPSGRKWPFDPGSKCARLGWRLALLQFQPLVENTRDCGAGVDELGARFLG